MLALTFVTSQRAEKKCVWLMEDIPILDASSHSLLRKVTSELDLQLASDICAGEITGILLVVSGRPPKGLRPSSSPLPPFHSPKSQLSSSPTPLSATVSSLLQHL